METPGWWYAPIAMGSNGASILPSDPGPPIARCPAAPGASSHPVPDPYPDRDRSMHCLVDAAASSASAARSRADALWWLGGVALGVAVIGPALRPGSLLNLDLVVAPRIPVPSGVWALGPELPRRVPLFVPLAWLSVVVGTYAVKLLLLAAVAVAAVGASRLVPAASSVTVRVSSALVYALSPFLVTRIATGGVTIVAAYALLPW